MPVIQSVWTENGLTFTFPPNSIASKYDDWSHYRNQFQSTCRGSKAVDLVYLDKNVTWLIEVKDFRVHSRTKTIELPEEIAIKVRDTLAGLVSASFYACDPDEKCCAKKLLRTARLRVVVHLEQPTKHSTLRPRAIEPDKLLLKLRTLLKAIDVRPLIVDTKSLHADMNWTVT